MLLHNNYNMKIEDDALGNAIRFLIFLIKNMKVNFTETGKYILLFAVFIKKLSKQLSNLMFKYFEYLFCILKMNGFWNRMDI